MSSACTPTFVFLSLKKHNIPSETSRRNLMPVRLRPRPRPCRCATPHNDAPSPTAHITESTRQKYKFIAEELTLRCYMHGYMSHCAIQLATVNFIVPHQSHTSYRTTWTHCFPVRNQSMLTRIYSETCM